MESFARGKEQQRLLSQTATHAMSGTAVACQKRLIAEHVSIRRIRGKSFLKEPVMLKRTVLPVALLSLMAAMVGCEQNISDLGGKPSPVMPIGESHFFKVVA